ncbi:hypothetical protein MTO96_011221 [Rhipicephalus appendiculatus]
MTRFKDVLQGPFKDALRDSLQGRHDEDKALNSWPLSTALSLVIVFIIAIIMTPFKDDSAAKACNIRKTDSGTGACSRPASTRASAHATTSRLRSLYRHNDFRDTLRLGSTKVPVDKKASVMYEMQMKASSSGDSTSLHIHLILSLFRHILARWHNVSNEAVSAVTLAVLLAYKYQSPFWLTIPVIDQSSSPSRRVVVIPARTFPCS